MSDPAIDLAFSAAKPLATKLIDVLLRPVVSVGRIVTDSLVDTFTNRFSDYLARQYAKHSYLPTIVFQVRRPIEDLYIPLSVSEGRSMIEQVDSTKFKLDRYQPNFLPLIGRVLLIDDAGMGKTTVSRYLLVQATKNLSTVPALVELRHLSSDRTLFDVLLAELNPPESDQGELRIDKRQLTRLLDKGIFTFFLDGYDEIVNKHREAVTIDIKAFVDAYPNNKFMLTSRPEHALASFPSFRAFRIEPLKKQEAYELIRKYDCNGERSQRLIERLEDPSLRAVHEFLKNPLLTTLLYRAYDYKNTIPLKKPTFYRQVYDALYEWHDLTKDGYSTRTKECGLDIDGFHKILRGLGFISVMRGRVEATTDEFLGWIREARGYAPELKFSESDFLEDAIRAVPVLRCEGSAILWAHKSMAEYFASQYIVTDAKQDQERICDYIANAIEIQRFRNVLDLLYDSDIAVFGRHFISALLKFYRATVNRLRILFPSTPIAEIEQRASVTFTSLFAIYPDASNPELFSSQISHDASRAAAGWALQTQISGLPPEQLIPEGVTINFRSAFESKTHTRHLYSRSLLFLHPMHTVLEILTEKKHPLVMQQQFFPPEPKQTRVVGVRKNTHHLINYDEKAIWNSPKNFSMTTAALMREVRGIINTKRIDAVLAEIDGASRQSKTTSDLLSSLAR